MKKSCACFMAAVMAAGMLTGCGQKNTGEAGQAAGSGEATQVRQETTEPAVDSSAGTGEKVKISYCSWMTKGEDKITNDNFALENPDIEVETISLDGSQYDTLLRTKVLAGDAPDVFIATAAQMRAFAKDGYLMELADVASVDTLLADLTDLDRLTRIDGKLYGFPMNPTADIDQVYYNKNYFKDKGFKEPATVEEFDQLLSDIKADGKEPIIIGGKDSWTSNAFAKSYAKAMNLPKYDGMEFDEKLLAGDAKMSDYYRGTYEMWEKYVKSGYISPASVSLTYDQSVQYFADGNAALLAQGTWIATMDNVTGAEGMDLGAFLMPVPKADDGKRYLAGSSPTYLVVSASTKNPEAAMKLVDYWTTPEVLKEYGDRTSTPTLYPVGYDISPVLAGVEASKNAEDVVLDFSGQLTKVPQGVYDETQICMVNIAAGSSAESELDRLDSVFEKSKSTMSME